MAKNDKRNIVLKQATYSQFSNRSEKQFPAFDLLIFDNGDIAFSLRKTLFHKQKYKLEIANDDLAKIETSTASGDYTSMSIKITDTDGHINILDVVVIGFKSKRGAVAAKIPAILSSLYGERYSKI